MALRATKGDVVVTVDETEIIATGPATAIGFSDLILAMAMVHEKWRVEIEGENYGG